MTQKCDEEDLFEREGTPWTGEGLEVNQSLTTCGTQTFQPTNFQQRTTIIAVSVREYSATNRLCQGGVSRDSANFT